MIDFLHTIRYDNLIKIVLQSFTYHIIAGPSTPESFFQQIPRKAELTKEKIAESQLEQPQKKDFSTQTDDTLFNTEDRQITSDNSETKPLSQYKFRNTVDLGQKCEPTAKNETDRSARSMSAPPEDCRMRHPPSAMGQYLSGNDKGLGANEPTVNQFANTCSSSSDQQPHVRHIPIFVEGRDEPVVNTDLGQSFPQQETFVKSDKAKASATRGPIFNAALNLTDPPNQKSNPIPEPAAPRPVPSISDPILKIQNIQKDVLELMLQVENFVGVRKDKQYIFLDEMLTRNLLKLDDVDTEGKENIRQARKEAIKCIQKCIAVLEAKADAQAEKVESVQAVGEPQVTEANKAPNDASLQQCSKDNTETKNTTTNAEVKDNTAINLNQVNKKDGQNTPPNQQSNNSTSKDEPICSS